MIELNDLYDYENYKIYQNTDYFKFSLDSILLAEVVPKKNINAKIIDLCTGNAVIPLVLDYYGFNDVTGIELQPEIFELAKKSLEYNKVNIKIINDNIKSLTSIFRSEEFDIITCNPPYFKVDDTSLINNNKVKAIARHEIELNLDVLFKNSSYILKNEGSMFLVHRVERLSEIIKIADKYHLIVKELCLLATKNDKIEMVLIKLVKNGKEGLKINSIVNINEYSTYKHLFEK